MRVKMLFMTRKVEDKVENNGDRNQKYCYRTTQTDIYLTRRFFFYAQRRVYAQQ